MRRLAAQGVTLKIVTPRHTRSCFDEVPLGVNLYGTRTEEFKRKGALRSTGFPSNYRSLR